MAMFQPEMATTWVSPAVAKASLISGAIDDPHPEQDPAPRAASGSGTSSFRPSSSLRRMPARTAARRTVLRPPGRPGPRDAADPLPGEVLAIREAVEVLGQLDARGEPAGGRRRRRQRHGAATPAGGRSIEDRAVASDRHDAEDELHAVLARARIIDHRPEQLVLVTVDEPGHRHESGSRAGSMDAPRHAPTPIAEDADPRTRVAAGHRVASPTATRAAPAAGDRDGGDGDRVGPQDAGRDPAEHDRKEEGSQPTHQPAVATPWMSSSWPRLITPAVTASSSELNGRSLAPRRSSGP